LAYGLVFGPIGLSMVPIIGVFFIHGLIAADLWRLAFAVGIGALLMSLVAAGLIAERDRLRDLPLVPIQLAYNSVLTFLTLVAATRNALHGLRPRWRTNRRQGIGKLVSSSAGSSR
jgi:hypothetical protein